MLLITQIVEGHFEDGKVNALRNAHAAVMLVQWLPDIESHDLQTWLALSLVQLARGGKYNQIICCDAGMLKAILDTCSQHHKLHSGTLSQYLHSLAVVYNLLHSSLLFTFIAEEIGIDLLFCLKYL